MSIAAALVQSRCSSSLAKTDEAVHPYEACPGLAETEAAGPSTHNCAASRCAGRREVPTYTAKRIKRGWKWLM